MKARQRRRERVWRLNGYFVWHSARICERLLSAAGAVVERHALALLTRRLGEAERDDIDGIQREHRFPLGPFPRGLLWRIADVSPAEPGRERGGRGRVGTADVAHLMLGGAQPGEVVACVVCIWGSVAGWLDGETHGGLMAVVHLLARLVAQAAFWALGAAENVAQ